MTATAPSSTYAPVPIGELCEFLNGGTPSKANVDFWDGDIPWITSAEINDGEVAPPRFKITQDAIDESSTRLVPAGTLLLVIRTGVGKVGIAPYDLTFNQDINAVLPDPKRLDKQYLRRFLESQGDHFEKFSRGATVKGITREHLGRLAIPTPFPDDPRRSLAEQKRIAAILDKADAIRRRRQEAARLADTLIPSVFYEMFGDPAANPKRLPVATIGELAPVLTGATPSRLVADYYGGGIPWVKTTEVTNGIIRATEESLTEQGMKSSRCELYPVGSLVIALYGQGATRGRTSLLAIEAAANQACAIIPPKPTYVTSFLWSQLRMSYERLRGEARGGNQPNLNLQIVRSFEVLNPPLDRQKEFDRHFKRHAALLETQAANEKQSDDLFNSLVQRAFRGEL